MTTVGTDFALEDARAGANKVAETHGLTLYIWRLDKTGRYLINNSEAIPYPNATFVEQICPPNLPSSTTLDPSESELKKSNAKSIGNRKPRKI
jgi:hypothetical protein